ncbi:MAG: NAD(P) transhydrogenase subunit alpha [Aestuariibacter sp.]
MEFIYLAFILVLAAFLGFELIQKVPATLHTPLMSGANAISGVTLIGALVAAGTEMNTLTTWLGFASVVFATINVIGGYMVTNRMLSMFKSKQKNADK